MQVRSLVSLVLLLVPAGLAAAGSGCTSSRVIHRENLRSGDIYARSRVFLQNGTRYEFLRVAVYPNTVVGEYKIAVERSSPGGGPAGQAVVYYEDEIHAHHMALVEVDSVAVLRRDPVKTVLFATGAAGVGFLMIRAIDSGSRGKNGASNPGSMRPSP